MRDICVQQPNFPKLTEICIKLIRRINDEDGEEFYCYNIIITNLFPSFLTKLRMQKYILFPR